MAKSKTVFMCQECGFDSPKWLGRCPGCGQWNSFVEEKLREEKSTVRTLRLETASRGRSVPITQVDAAASPRRASGLAEFDRVLGGGFVPGSLVLLGGDPGIGKSTLLLQVAAGLSAAGHQVLYVSGEESDFQIRLRAERLGRLHDGLLLFTETQIERVLEEIERCKPQLVVIDSIQTMYHSDVSSAPGSVSQVREVTAFLLQAAKQSGIPICIIGHVTKDGAIAGPRLLEHMVDVVLYFEGERNYAFRVLRAMKNRFGSTHVSGIYAMGEDGLEQVGNPSALLLQERPVGVPGSVVLCYVEGGRPLLIEMQALVATTAFGMARRTAAGFDLNRLNLLLAILEKRLGLSMSTCDAYLNAVGGMRVDEPAADLAVALALVSSLRNQPADAETVVMGEVGLGGEVRQVPHAELRVREAQVMGFRRFVMPKGNALALEGRFAGAEIIGVEHLAEARDAVLCR